MHRWTYPPTSGTAKTYEQTGDEEGFIRHIGDLGSAVGPSVGLGLIPVVGLNAVYMGCAGVFAMATVFSVWYALRDGRVRPVLNN